MTIPPVNQPIKHYETMHNNFVDEQHEKPVISKIRRISGPVFPTPNNSFSTEQKGIIIPEPQAKCRDWCVIL